uniref:CCHC-type domain-containing protein n=1 Tax=Lactuca sativa TaxID=4236 RepID=A0A9R1VTK4_LACSA|nr:hypothetical protein LSAT_V11C400217610 [Lactuca sativa]
MPFHRNNRHTHEAPLLKMDLTTFQVAVTAVVTAAMAQLNANNTNRGGDSVNNTSQSNDHGNQRVIAYQGTQNPKLKNSKRASGNKRKGQSTQGYLKKQLVITVNSDMTTTTPTLGRTYAGSLPQCNKYSFHHHGICREIHCTSCNRKGHTAKYCRTYPPQNQQQGNNNNRNNNTNNSGNNADHKVHHFHGSHSKILRCLFLHNFMQLSKFKGDSNSIMVCDQKRGKIHLSIL